MSDQIDKIIDVTILKETQVPSTESFNQILIAAEFLTSAATPPYDTAERVREFGTLNEIGIAFGTTGTIYKMAEAVFSQNPSVDKLYIGRKLTGVDGTEDWTAALTAMKADNNDWYGVLCGTRVLAEQQLIAAWVESNKKLCVLSSNDANIVDGTGDIAESVDTSNYERTGVIYDPLGNATGADPGTDKFMDCAWMGKLFPADTIPGSSNWAHKTIAGPAVYTVTEAQYTTAIGKRCNLYQKIGGLDKTIFGTVGADGLYFDITWGVDWLEARIQTLVYTPISSSRKVPYTDAGIQIIVAQLKAALQEAVDAGILADYTVSYPTVDQVPAADKSNRVLNNVTFVGTLAGAINTVKISGTVVL